MNGPVCLPKLDVEIDDNRVIFSRCCIAEKENCNIIEIDEILNLSLEELEYKIFNEYSKLDNVYEKSRELNCSGTCVGHWNSKMNTVIISHKLCNFKCTICRHDFYRPINIGKIKECYFKILSACTKSEKDICIGLTTKGEPFVWKNDVLNLIKSTNKRVAITSNLSLFDDEVIKNIEDGYFKNVYLNASVDSFNPEIYREIRRPSDEVISEKVFNTVVKLIEYKKQGLLQSFTVNAVLSDQNFFEEDIRNTIAFFKSHNYDSFTLSNDLRKNKDFYNVEWFTEELKKEAHFFFCS